MRVHGLNHVNIRTPDVEGTARFYADLLGLDPSAASAQIPPDQGRWLCDREGRAIVHLGKGDGKPGPTGAIDHVAFTCSGRAELIDRLKRRGVEFRLREHASLGFSQVFVRDPNGVLLELNFSGD